tara:strand:+ start:41386 stop:42657 length:1272 start_codon:yes stop_codon:yes gene_type:complete
MLQSRPSAFTQNASIASIMTLVIFTGFLPVHVATGQETKTNGSGGLSVETVKEHFEKTNSEKAARWLVAHAYPKAMWNSLRASERDVLEKAILRIPSDSTEDAQLKVDYAGFISKKRGEKKAVPFLIAAAGSFPNLGLHAAKIVKESGDVEQAEQLAQDAMLAFKKLHAASPDDVTHAMGLATSLLFLKKNTEALVTLIAASQKTESEEDRDRLNYAIGDAIVLWILDMNEIEADPENPAADPRNNIWKMMNSAVDAAPNNVQVLSELRKQLMLIKDKNEAEFDRDKELLFGGTQPGFYELVRGVAALINNQERIAGINLNRAVELQPKYTLVLKNLAVAFGSGYRGALDNSDMLNLGLKLSNVAIKKTPDAAPEYYETRGQILIRLKKYREAISDLEKASEDPEREAVMKRLVEDCKLYLDQ